MNGTAFELPALGSTHPPAFTSAAGCRDWLAVQPLANPVQSQAALLRQLNLLNRHTLPAGERLKILELLREPVAFAQSEATRKFAGRPLPLSPPEQAALDSNRNLWQALQTGYLHCLTACQGPQAELRQHAALAAQRVLHALRGELLDIYRAPSDPPARLWRTLHRVYALAEELAVTTQPLHDTLQADHPGSSVAAAYAHTLLMELAGPYELSSRQLLQVERWLARWGAKVSVLAAPPPAPRVPPLVVDLASERPVVAADDGGAQMRWLDLSELARSVKRRIVHLQKGASPAALGLGEDCVQPACEHLLRHLYRHWFKGGVAREHPRRAGSGQCRLVGGHDAIHYYLSGRIFRQPGQAETMTKTQIEEIATFGRIATRHEEDYSRAQGFHFEFWRVLDESASGLRLARPLGQGGGRLGSGQLVGIRPQDAGFLLAVARWVRITGGELQAGIEILSGQPRPVALRGTGLSAINEKYRPGFRLPAVPALHDPESVIVPAGWFRPGRVIELFDEASRQIRLTRQLDRGSDFERCAFDPL